MWCKVAKHIPGDQNTLADGTYRWPSNEVEDDVNRLTKEEGWIRCEIRENGNKIINALLENDTVYQQLDDQLWSLMQLD